LGRPRPKEKDLTVLSYLGLGLYGTTGMAVFFMQLLPPDCPSLLQRRDEAVVFGWSPKARGVILWSCSGHRLSLCFVWVVVIG